MEGKLNFSLPENKPQKSSGQVGVVLLLLVAIGLGAVSVVLQLKGSASSPVTMIEPGLSTEQAKDLATKLSQRNLYDQAASVWQDYLVHSDLNDQERAQALFQIGLLREKAEQYGPAVEAFYRSEMTAPLDNLANPIKSHIQTCFERMGKFSALRYELMDRTGYHPTDEAGTSKVVAEIGAEKITETDLGALIEQTIDNQLAPMTAFMSPEQMQQQKQRMLEQFKTPSAKQQFLTQWLSQELLYRQALESELNQKPEVKRQLDDMTRQLLAQQLMTQELASKIHITETDLSSYYEANKAKYVQPAQAQIRHIRVSDEQTAKDVIARLQDGDDFAQLAQDLSLDESTQQDGGSIPSPVTPGSTVPGIGNAPGLNTAIFSVETPALLQQPFQGEQGWEVIQVDSRTPERQIPYDQAQQQVMRDLTQQKQQEVQDQFLRQIMDQYQAVIHTSVFKSSES